MKSNSARKLNTTSYQFNNATRAGGRSLNAVWECENITANQTLILQYFASKADFTGSFTEARWFSIRSIEASIKLSRATIFRELARLVLGGYLMRKQRFANGSQQASTYAISEKIFDEYEAKLATKDPHLSEIYPSINEIPPPSQVEIHAPSGCSPKQTSLMKTPPRAYDPPIPEDDGGADLGEIDISPLTDIGIDADPNRIARSLRGLRSREEVDEGMRYFAFECRRGKIKNIDNPVGLLVSVLKRGPYKRPSHFMEIVQPSEPAVRRAGDIYAD